MRPKIGANVRVEVDISSPEGASYHTANCIGKVMGLGDDSVHVQVDIGRGVVVCCWVADQDLEVLLGVTGVKCPPCEYDADLADRYHEGCLVDGCHCSCNDQDLEVLS